MNILICAPGFAPYAASENICNSKLGLALMRRGYDVSVISRQDEGFNYGVDWVEPWLPLRSVTREVRYEVGSRPGRVVDAARSLLAMGYYLPGLRCAPALELAMQLHKERPFDAILSRSPNDIGHLPALHMARKTGLPWVANWNDPPSHLWPYPYTTKSGRFMERMSVRFLAEVMETANCMTFPSERLKNHVLSQAGGGCARKTAVIPHLGFEGTLPTPEHQNGRFHICHAGNLSKERCPRTFLEGLSSFLTTTGAHDHVVLEVVGTEHPEMHALVASRNLDRCVRFSGRLSYLDTMSRLAQSDVLLVIEAPCEEGIFLPSKVADYACLGKPILAISPRSGTLPDLFAERGGGLCVDNRSCEDIAQALTHLYRMWREDDLRRLFPTDRLHEMFTVDSVLSRYDRLFADLGLA